MTELPLKWFKVTVRHKNIGETIEWDTLPATDWSDANPGNQFATGIVLMIQLQIYLEKPMAGW